MTRQYADPSKAYRIRKKGNLSQNSSFTNLTNNFINKKQNYEQNQKPVVNTLGQTNKIKSQANPGLGNKNLLTTIMNKPKITKKLLGKKFSSKNL